MIRSIISLLIGGSLLVALSLNYSELPVFISILMGFFGLLFCFIAFGSARHHRQLLLARKTISVAASIFIRATAQRKGPDRLVAEVTIAENTWRGILTGWQHQHNLAGHTHEGKAWLSPKNGAPLEIGIQGQIITPVPIVIKVNPDSALEAIVRKVHSLDNTDKS